MLFCHTCGAKNAVEDRLCLACGRPLPVACDGCSTANPATARYCGACGMEAPIAKGMRAALQSQRPVHLADRAEASRRSLEGERKRVTVMFADIKGSLSLIADRDAEEAQGLLDSLLETMTAAVHEFEGTVTQVLGDGFVALFGAPIAHEDHAVRAAHAALSIQQAVRGGHRLWQSLGVVPQVRIGLSSGEVVIRAIDNDLNVDYRAVGRTTHLAARMEQTAPAGTIRMTRETMRLIEGLFEAVSLGSIEIKGLDEPVEVFELRAALFARTRLQARNAQGLSPFVGREQELRRLHDRVDALSVRSSVVALVGEAGIGKSRLVHELLQSLSVTGLVALEARGFSYRWRSPFVVLQTLLRSYLGIDEGDDIDVIDNKLAAVLVPAQAALRAPLRALLGAGDDRDFRRLDPADRRKQIMSALTRVLSRLCAERPVLLVAEDLQWCDADSLSFFAQFLSRLPERNLLVVLTYRPEFDGLCEIPKDELSLSSLTRFQASTLLAKVLGHVDNEASARLEADLVDRTHGNPLFIEECLRSLVDSRAVVQTEHGFAVVRPDAVVELPDTAEAVLAARMDRLPSEVKALLQAAAVIGTELPRNLLERVAELSQTALADGLRQLVALGFLQLLSGTNHERYRFAHSMTHETAYRSLLKRQRKGLHERVVLGIEALFQARLGEFADQLAEQAARAGMWERAARYCALHSVQAAGRFANREAVAAIERGLEALPHLPEGPERDAMAVDLRLSALAGLMPLGQKERMVSVLREAERIALRMDDPMRLGAVYSQLSTALWLVSRHEPALQSGHKALAIADKTGHFPLSLAARYNIGMCHTGLGQYPEAITILGSLSAELKGEHLTRRFGWATYPSVTCATFLGMSLVMIGELDEALATLEAGTALADQVKHPYSQAIAREELGYCYIVRGQLERARATLESTLQLCIDHEVYTMYPAAAGRLGLTMVLQGNVDEGIALVEDALARKTYEAGGSYVYFYLVYALSRGHLARGDLAEALARAREVVAFTHKAKERGHNACGTLLLADVLQAAGQLQLAEAHYLETQASAAELGLRPVQAACQRGLRTLYAQTARPEDAARLEQDAQASYRALGIENGEVASV